MARIFHRRKACKAGTSITVQGFHKSVRDVIAHFMSTGELLIEPSSTNSYDNTDSSVRVQDFDVNKVVKDTSLVEAALLAHNERVPSSRPIEPKDDKPAPDAPAPDVPVSE